MMAHTVNPSIQEAHKGKLQQIPGQDGLLLLTFQQQKPLFNLTTKKDKLQCHSLPGWKAEAQRVKVACPQGLRARPVTLRPSDFQGSVSRSCPNPPEQKAAVIQGTHHRAKPTARGWRRVLESCWKQVGKAWRGEHAEPALAIGGGGRKER